MNLDLNVRELYVAVIHILGSAAAADASKSIKAIVKTIRDMKRICYASRAACLISILLLMRRGIKAKKHTTNSTNEHARRLTASSTSRGAVQAWGERMGWGR